MIISKPKLYEADPTEGCRGKKEKQKKVLWKAFNLVQCIGNILVMAGAIPSA